MFSCTGTNVAGIPNSHGSRNTNTKDSSGNTWVPRAVHVNQGSDHNRMAIINTGQTDDNKQADRIPESSEARDQSKRGVLDSGTA